MGTLGLKTDLFVETIFRKMEFILFETSLFNICSFLIYEKGVKNIELSTNGGTRTKQFWEELAELSKQTKKLVVHWSIDGVTRNDVEGLMYGTEMLLSPNINLEIAFDDKDKAGLDDEYYAKIMFVHPPRNSASISDGISSDMWRAQKDMSDEMLTKVKRNNKIMVEFSGSASIVRAD